MPMKAKALLIAVFTTVLSVIIMTSIAWLVTVLSSSTWAIILAVLFWGFIVYKLSLTYLAVQKELD